MNGKKSGAPLIIIVAVAAVALRAGLCVIVPASGMLYVGWQHDERPPPELQVRYTERGPDGMSSPIEKNSQQSP